MKQPESLGHLVRRIREDNDWTLMDVVKNSDHTITSGYVSMIETGQVTKPSPKKIKALAKGLRLENDLLIRYIMELPTDFNDDEQLLVSTFRQLDDRGKLDLLLIAKTIRNSLADDAQAGDQPKTDNVVGLLVQKKKNR